MAVHTLDEEEEKKKSKEKAEKNKTRSSDVNWSIDRSRRSVREYWILRACLLGIFLMQSSYGSLQWWPPANKHVGSWKKLVWEQVFTVKVRKWAEFWIFLSGARTGKLLAQESWLTGVFILYFELNGPYYAECATIKRKIAVKGHLLAAYQNWY